MSGGVGRGRGWLNLKTQNARCPGSDDNTSPPVVNHSASPHFHSSENRTFSDAGNDYSDLISKINQLDISDDGIKFNQKIRYIIESWTQDCGNSIEVENSFEEIHQACLGDGNLATKLVLLIASRTFLSQEIHEQNIRLMFLRKLQDNFESCVQLQTSNPMCFRNSVQMMGEFFNKARLANGQQFAFMATPLISYLEMLLESASSVDLKLFTIQLYLNGSSLRQECPEKIAEILKKVRLMLCSEKAFSQECKLWLLLALEVASNRFALLPSDIHQFYHEQLGEQAMASFQGNHGALTVQTMHASKTLDSYQSNVSVLQVSTPSESIASTVDPVSPQNSVSDLGMSANYNSSGFQSDTSQNSNNARKDSHSNGGKTGRPILGVGARLHKNRVHNESSNNWEVDKTKNETNSVNWNQNRSTPSNTDKSRNPNWNKNKTQNDGTPENNWREREDKKGSDPGSQKKNWEKKKTPPKAAINKKGWEHDDRFDTDYS